MFDKTFSQTGTRAPSLWCQGTSLCAENTQFASLCWGAEFCNLVDFLGIPLKFPIHSWYPVTLGGRTIGTLDLANPVKRAYFFPTFWKG